jgi:hypothetical protein
MADEGKVRSRPRAMMPRNGRLHIRLTPGERALIAAAAEASSMAAAVWIRHHALLAAAGMPRPLRPFQRPAAGHLPGALRYRITGRFTAADHEAIVDHARACGLSGSALVRQLVLGCEPMVRQPRVRSALAAVQRADGSLRQLLRLAGTGAALAPDLMRAVAELRGEIHAVRDALLRADSAGAQEPAE